MALTHTPPTVAIKPLPLSRSRATAAGSSDRVPNAPPGILGIGGARVTARMMTASLGVARRMISVLP